MGVNADFGEGNADGISILRNPDQVAALPCSIVRILLYFRFD